MIYMDNASTTVVDKEAFDIAKKYPSSVEVL